jgi:hypothetical protein
VESGIEQVVEGSDPHEGHRRICEGDMVRFGVGHEMEDVKLLCYRWLTPFLKLPIDSPHFPVKRFPV